MNTIIEQINNLKVFEENIEDIISNGVGKLNFSIFGSDYKTFNQDIEKTIGLLNKEYNENIIDKLKKGTNLNSITEFIKNSEKFQNDNGKDFEELYRYFVINNIKLKSNSKLNRLLFKALSRLSFINQNGKYIFPKILYNEEFLKNLNNKIDELAHYIKEEGLKRNPNQGKKSNIIAWIKNIGITDDNIEGFLSLFGEEQDNMYEQKLWFFLGYLHIKKHPLDMILEKGYLSIINNLFGVVPSYSSKIQEPLPEYNSNKKTENIAPKSSKMIQNLTSQESLLLLSLLTKSFSILYGVSGTGKSRVVKELWKKIYPEGYKKYFHKEAVPPNWFDETEVLGRYNEIEKYKEGSFIKKLEEAIKDPEHNYVYLLDEMNLSHIEQYFAQYLSAVEELNDDNAWIHVGENNVFSKKSFLEKTLKIKENSFDKTDYLVITNKIYHKINTLGIENKRIGKIIINDKEIDINDTNDIYKKAIEFIIDKYIIEQNKKEIKGKNISIIKDNYSFNSEYKGYHYFTGKNIKEKIVGLYELIEEIKPELSRAIVVYLDNKKNNIKTKNIPFYKNIIYYYNDNDEIVGKSLKMPKNLFVVGTINLDETTKSISPKVVDRANLIEFNDIGDFLGIEEKESRYKLDFLENLNISVNFEKLLKIREGISELKGDIELPEEYKLDEKGKTLEIIAKLYTFLKVFKLHFSYRTIKEILIFIQIGKELLKEKSIENLENKLFDIAIMQKVLPKLNGVIDPNLKLYLENKDNKGDYLWYDIEDSLLRTEIKEKIKKGFYNNEEDFTNSAIKLERMQQFFDTYQNVNYFLS